MRRALMFICPTHHFLGVPLTPSSGWWARATPLKNMRQLGWWLATQNSWENSKNGNQSPPTSKLSPISLYGGFHSHGGTPNKKWQPVPTNQSCSGGSILLTSLIRRVIDPEWSTAMKTLKTRVSHFSHRPRSKDPSNMDYGTSHMVLYIYQ